MQDIKKIDIHAHATAFPEYHPINRIGNRFVSGTDVIAMYDRLNVEKGVLLPISAPESQVTPLTSEGCKHLTVLYPDRFVWFCNVDPRAWSNEANSDLYTLLKAYKEMGALGCGEITAQLYFDDPKMDNLLTACEELDMPITIHLCPHFDHTYGIVDEIGLRRMEKMLKKHPKLKVFGHSQVFWAHISSIVTPEELEGYPMGKVLPGRVVELMREYPNLYGDLSANSGMNSLMRDRDHAARFVEEFSDRLLYGCDICAASNTHPFEFDAFLDEMVADGYIRLENYRKIVRDNAIRVLGLEE